MMKIVKGIPVYGSSTALPPHEDDELITFFNALRAGYPDLGSIAIHPRNEGMRNRFQMAKEKAMGLVVGAADIIIPGNQSFVCEMKSRKEWRPSLVSAKQWAYLEACRDAGAFACVALGADGAMLAVDHWLALRNKDCLMRKHADGTVIDSITGLMWQQSGSDDWLSHEDAGHYLAKLNRERFAGYGDWRLPTLEEAESLLRPEVDGMCIKSLFDTRQQWVWTSTPTLRNAYIVSYKNGESYGCTSEHLAWVRACRAWKGAR